MGFKVGDRVVGNASIEPSRNRDKHGVVIGISNGSSHSETIDVEHGNYGADTIDVRWDDGDTNLGSYSWRFDREDATYGDGWWTVDAVTGPSILERLGLEQREVVVKTIQVRRKK